MHLQSFIKRDCEDRDSCRLEFWCRKANKKKKKDRSIDIKTENVFFQKTHPIIFNFEMIYKNSVNVMFGSCTQLNTRRKRRENADGKKIWAFAWLFGSTDLNGQAQKLVKGCNEHFYLFSSRFLHRTGRKSEKEPLWKVQLGTFHQCFGPNYNGERTEKFSTTTSLRLQNHPKIVNESKS